MIQRKILIRNGYVITMDSQRTTLSRGEVLIGDDKILAVGHGLPAEDAEIIDADGGIIMPGFVDNHRHMWQTNLRAMLADWTLHEYMRGIRFSISPVLRPEDIGAGNYIDSDYSDFKKVNGVEIKPIITPSLTLTCSPSRSC